MTKVKKIYSTVLGALVGMLLCCLFLQLSLKSGLTAEKFGLALLLGHLLAAALPGIVFVLLQKVERRTK